MKIFLFLIAVFVLLWLLRTATARRDAERSHQGKPGKGGEPRPIVACRQCGVHLPRDEALPGRGGVFCGEAHRAAFERGEAPPT